MAVVDMKGSKIAEAVKFSREKSGQKPEFLHLDGQAEADKATHEIKEINKSGPKICRVVSRRFNSLGQLGMMTARDPEDPLSTRSILDG
ncbi:unnamed protein product [Cladocopium goreaui]|uniref:Uncharacterized protein n=1 Tax=Cladocopium goreaui TaxID=2562237 RepID=A0A9P1M2P0_9DINO|nr:unnamed protein product [Cladocopium goreaui]